MSYRIASPQRTYSREQLAAALGVSKWWVHKWRKLRVLPEPIGKGRAAHYTDLHLREGRALLAQRDARIKPCELGPILEERGSTLTEYLTWLESSRA